MEAIAILEAFTDLPDPRRKAGQRHQQTLCLAPGKNLLKLAHPSNPPARDTNR